jgi:SAM-dependent methyltransferase
MNKPQKQIEIVDQAAATPSINAYQDERIAHWDEIAAAVGHRKSYAGSYHKRLNEVLRFQVSPGQRVLEFGCGAGDRLAVLEPSYGVGIDFSEEMIKRAGARHPDLNFILADVHDLENIDEKFDVIILSDFLNDIWDVQRVLMVLHPLCTKRTRIVINIYSHLWELPLKIVRKLGLAKPSLEQNWLTGDDVINLLGLADFEVVRTWEENLLPLPLPLLSTLANRFLVKLWPFRYFALSVFVVARPVPIADKTAEKPAVSIIVAARNEEGHIRDIVKRVPELGGGTELIFVEGHSTDDTYAEIERVIAANPHKNCKLFRQTGRGKGDAVRLGFDQASGDILMILDADLTVLPEDLPRFYEALVSGKGEFINGVRLVYPMEKEAMRFFNLLGNKFFSLAFSWLLGQSIKDTLCGTKVMWKSEYQMLSRNRHYFGDFDPFGDFDLIFGAAKLNLKIIDMPIRYHARVYGETNIQRWSHGWILLKMVAFAASRIKFV